jgi:hypothetical protein
VTSMLPDRPLRVPLIPPAKRNSRRLASGEPPRPFIQVLTHLLFLSVDVGPMSNTHDNYLFRYDPENHPEVSDSQPAVSIPLADSA